MDAPGSDGNSGHECPCRRAGVGYLSHGRAGEHRPPREDGHGVRGRCDDACSKRRTRRDDFTVVLCAETNPIGGVQGPDAEDDQHDGARESKADPQRLHLQKGGCTERAEHCVREVDKGCAGADRDARLPAETCRGSQAQQPDWPDIGGGERTDREASEHCRKHGSIIPGAVHPRRIVKPAAREPSYLYRRPQTRCRTWTERRDSP